MRHHHGFTLLEIMIALAVFATVGAALVKNAALTVRQTGLIEEKTIAVLIAENELDRYRLAPRDPAAFAGTGRDRTPVRMAGRDWEVVTDVRPTDNENVRRIEVSVYREDNLDRAVTTLTGFLGRF